MLTRIKDAIKVKKTYITAVVGLLGAVVAFGDGAIDIWGLLTAAWIAAEVCWVRAGIKKAEIAEIVIGDTEVTNAREA